MTLAVRAIYEHGVLRLLKPLDLREGQAITVKIETPFPTPLQERMAGLHAGTIWVSADFDAELPDAFWLGDA
jgi:predicted DNA-binding antitoxin AbrB/MazE fold protein